MVDNLSIIVAMGHNGAIGAKGDLLCRISADLKRFKSLTMGHAIIMGRKTFESLPKGALPGRLNIVITRDPDYKASGATVVYSFDEALKASSTHEKRFIIGGGQIYDIAFPHASTLELTEIDADFPQADTWLTNFKRDEWRVVEQSELFPTDEKNEYPFRFVTLTRI